MYNIVCYSDYFISTLFIDALRIGAVVWSFCFVYSCMCFSLCMLHFCLQVGCFVIITSFVDFRFNNTQIKRFSSGL